MKMVLREYTRSGAVPWEMTAEQVLRLIRQEGIRFIDLQFTDLPGKLQHVTVTAEYFDESRFVEGVPKLDGSSIRGFAEIHESDMVLKPDPTTFALLPWSQEGGKTARMICDVYRGFGEGRFNRDPRYVAQKAERYLREQGFDTSYWGPEIEFFVFDKVEWDVSVPQRGMSFVIESKEGAWNSRAHGTSYPIRYKEGYFPAPPQDTLMEYRNLVSTYLLDYFGVQIDAHHHEVATAGQCEIDMRFDTLVRMADKAQTYKYVAKNVAKQMGLIATFMPKPIFGDNASGMHVHVSLWKDGVNLFYDPNDGYAELSQLARYFIGGSWSTAGLSPRSLHLPPTPTRGWFPVTRLRSSSRGAGPTAQRTSGSRSTSGGRPTRPSPRGSSSGPQTPLLIRTSALRRFSAQGSTALRRRQIREIPSTRTSTT